MEKILIAFSGGPDSVFLYHFLKKQNKKLAICYVNHNVREDVYKDIEFVKQFSKNENIKYFIENINLTVFSENIAREKRYELLEKVRKENGYDYIATGHNKNDNVETIIFRLIRGTGLDGLKGIPKTRGKVIRPIINHSKEEILKYLKDNEIKYLVDYTNNQNIYSRNKIRNQIMPIMKEINENYLENISKFITILNEEEGLKQEIVAKLKEYNISYTKNKVDEIFSIKDKNGIYINLNNEYVWYKSYDFFGPIKLKDLKKEMFFKELYLGEEINSGEYSISLIDESRLHFFLEKKEYKLYNVGTNKKIIVRNRKAGDRIDNIKLKKIFIDKKIEKYKRDEIPIICDENNEVLIIPDIKISKKCKTISKNSNYIVILKGEKC